MKALLARFALRAVKRAVMRRSPKADLIGGSVLATMATGVMIWLDVPTEAAATIGANVGAICTTVANLLWGDDVDDGGT